MWFLIFFACFLTVFLLQAKLYRKKAMDSLTYRVRVSRDEAVEGDDVYIFEEITNGKPLPLPLVRVDLSLPEGLEFRMMGNRDLSGKSDRFRQSVGSSFVLRGNQTVTRRRQAVCRKRGIYEISSALLVTGDLLGSETLSGTLSLPKDRRNTLTVLPRIRPFSAEFTASLLSLGDETARFSLFTDPLRIAGSREYTPLDPMKSINWKSTAVHGRLMVNTVDYTKRPRFQLLLNMQTRPIEPDPAVPGIPGLLEEGISVCASILDRVSALDLPVRLLANTPPETVGGEPLSPEGEDIKILRTAPCKGKASVLDMLRLLAGLKLEISLPTERLLDRILQDPLPITEGGGLVFVSGYLDERMVNFFEEMKKLGVPVLFFITGRQNAALLLPEDMPVFYS